MNEWSSPWDEPQSNASPEYRHDHALAREHEYAPPPVAERAQEDDFGLDKRRGGGAQPAQPAPSLDFLTGYTDDAAWGVEEVEVRDEGARITTQIIKEADFGAAQHAQEQDQGLDQASSAVLGVDLDTSGGNQSWGRSPEKVQNGLGDFEGGWDAPVIDAPPPETSVPSAPKSSGLDLLDDMAPWDGVGDTRNVLKETLLGADQARNGGDIFDLEMRGSLGESEELVKEPNSVNFFDLVDLERRNEYTGDSDLDGASGTKDKQQLENFDGKETVAVVPSMTIFTDDELVVEAEASEDVKAEPAGLLGDRSTNFSQSEGLLLDPPVRESVGLHGPTTMQIAEVAPDLEFATSLGTAGTGVADVDATREALNRHSPSAFSEPEPTEDDVLSVFPERAAEDAMSNHDEAMGEGLQFVENAADLVVIQETDVDSHKLSFPRDQLFEDDGLGDFAQFEQALNIQDDEHAVEEEAGPEPGHEFSPSEDPTTVDLTSGTHAHVGTARPEDQALQPLEQSLSPNEEETELESVLDMSIIKQLFPALRDVEFTQETPYDLINSSSQRKAWHRISRHGSIRYYNSSDFDNYVRVTWPGSAIRTKVTEVVAKWIADDRVTGGSVFRARIRSSKKASRPDKAAVGSSSETTPGIARFAIAAPKPVASPSGFGWNSSTPQSQATALFPPPPRPPSERTSTPKLVPSIASIRSAKPSAPPSLLNFDVDHHTPTQESELEQQSVPEAAGDVTDDDDDFGNFVSSASESMAPSIQSEQPHVTYDGFVPPPLHAGSAPSTAEPFQDTLFDLSTPPEDFPANAVTSKIEPARSSTPVTQTKPTLHNDFAEFDDWFAMPGPSPPPASEPTADTLMAEPYQVRDSHNISNKTQEPLGVSAQDVKEAAPLSPDAAYTTQIVNIDTPVQHPIQKDNVFVDWYGEPLPTQTQPVPLSTPEPLRPEIQETDSFNDWASAPPPSDAEPPTRVAPESAQSESGRIDSFDDWASAPPPTSAEPATRIISPSPCPDVQRIDSFDDWASAPAPTSAQHSTKILSPLPRPEVQRIDSFDDWASAPPPTVPAPATWIAPRSPRPEGQRIDSFDDWASASAPNDASTSVHDYRGTAVLQADESYALDNWSSAPPPPQAQSSVVEVPPLEQSSDRDNDDFDDWSSAPLPVKTQAAVVAPAPPAEPESQENGDFDDWFSAPPPQSQPEDAVFDSPPVNSGYVQTKKFSSAAGNNNDTSIAPQSQDRPLSPPQPPLAPSAYAFPDLDDWFGSGPTRAASQPPPLAKEALFPLPVSTNGNGSSWSQRPMSPQFSIAPPPRPASAFTHFQAPSLSATSPLARSAAFDEILTLDTTTGIVPSGSTTAPPTTQGLLGRANEPGALSATSFPRNLQTLQTPIPATQDEADDFGDFNDSGNFDDFGTYASTPQPPPQVSKPVFDTPQPVTDEDFGAWGAWETDGQQGPTQNIEYPRDQGFQTTAQVPSFQSDGLAQASASASQPPMSWDFESFEQKPPSIPIAQERGGKRNVARNQDDMVDEEVVKKVVQGLPDWSYML